MKQIKLLQEAACLRNNTEYYYLASLSGVSDGLNLFLKSCNMQPLCPLYTLIYFVTTAGRCSLDGLATAYYVCKYSAIYPKRR